MRRVFYLLPILLFPALLFAQNVGIGNPAPTEKLHVDSGSIKIGKRTWDGTYIPLLKFGDGNYITLGEEEGDDKFTIRAKELLLRPSTSYTSIPITIQGTDNYSHFYYGGNEDTYLRGGKTTSNVIVGDGGGRVGVGVYPTRAGLEQNGVVGNTAAMFGGEGQGISLQRNWPAIGFNHWFDGAHHRSIGTGYAGQLGVNPSNGSLYYATWNINAPVPNGQLDFPNNLTQRFYISRFGNLGIGTDDPQSDITIAIPGDGNYDQTTNGLRFNTSINGNPTYWNILGAISDFYFVRNGFFLSGIANDGSYNQLSDKRYKKNIDYFNNSFLLEKLLQLKPAHYQMNTESEKSQYHFGFISQDVEAIFPELVSDNKGIKMMNYTGLIPILTKGIQEQQKQIEELKAELAELRKLILSKQ